MGQNTINDSSRLEKSLKYPYLTEDKELDTLEYSMNKDDHALRRLEKEAK